MWFDVLLFQLTFYTSSDVKIFKNLAHLYYLQQDKVKSAQGVRSNSIPIDKKCTSKVHRSIAKANESQAFVNEKILVCSIKVSIR